MTTWPAHRFEIGRVIDRGVGVVRRNLGVFVLLTLLLSGGPLAALALSARFNWSGGAVPLWLAGVGLLLAYLCFAYLLQGAIVRGALADLAGQPVRFGDCLAAGLGNFLPLAGIALLSTLGFVIGLALLIVPGVLLAVCWVAAGPVQVTERRGVFGSLARSADLTKGSRWQIFALLLMAGLASFAMNWIVGLVSGLAALTGEAGEWLQLGLNVAMNLVWSILTATGAASIYFELRYIRDDIGPADLVKVFD